MTATTIWRSSTGSASRRNRSQRCAHSRRAKSEQGTRFHYASNQTVAADAAAARGDRHHAERISDAAAVAADGRGSRRDMDQDPGRHRIRMREISMPILRDYGRLGILLANDGAVGGKQIVPKEYLLEATDWHRQPEAFAPRKATPFFGYGYQFWLFPGEKRRFRVARRLRSVDLRRSRTQARDGDHRRREERQRWKGAVRRASATRSGAGSSPNTEAGSHGQQAFARKTRCSRALSVLIESEPKL